jgi:geranylgeranyl diphosphate synthase type II
VGGKKADLETVKFLHTHKTGALITASVASGAIVAGAGESQVQSVLSYGKKSVWPFRYPMTFWMLKGTAKPWEKWRAQMKKREKAPTRRSLGLDESKKIQSDLVQEAVQDSESLW